MYNINYNSRHMEKFINEIKAFLYGALIFFQMEKETSAILITLIFADMFFGAVKASVVPTMKFQMSTFWSGLLKKALLLIIIMLLALLMRGFGYTDYKNIVSIVMKIMILNEGLSVLNSIRSIWQKKEFKANDFISVLIEKIEKALTRFMDKLIKIFDENTTCL